MPDRVETPNAETIAAIREVWEMKATPALRGKTYADIGELLAELEEEREDECS